MKAPVPKKRGLQPGTLPRIEMLRLKGRMGSRDFNTSDFEVLRTCEPRLIKGPGKLVIETIGGLITIVETDFDFRVFLEYYTCDILNTIEKNLMKTYKMSLKISLFGCVDPESLLLEGEKDTVRVFRVFVVVEDDAETFLLTRRSQEVPETELMTLFVILELGTDLMKLFANLLVDRELEQGHALRWGVTLSSPDLPKDLGVHQSNLKSVGRFHFSISIDLLVIGLKFILKHPFEFGKNITKPGTLTDFFSLLHGTAHLGKK